MIITLFLYPDPVNDELMIDNNETLEIVLKFMPY